MTDEQKAAYVASQTAILNARVAGMQAENAYRISLGQTPMYGEDAFEKAMNESGCYHNDVLTLFGDI